MKKSIFTICSHALVGIVLFAPVDSFAIEKNGDGVYSISNGSELAEFAVIVNNGELNACAKLTRDIDLNSIEWTPIGNSTNLYSGVFDGCGYTINNFSYTVPSTAKKEGYGLFGAVQNATIKDFVINGTLTAVGEGNGIIGRASGGVITDIHSYVNLDCESFTCKQIGGVVGRVTDQASVERCSFWGEMNVGGGSTDCYGGIAGYASSGVEFINCANYGTLSASVKCYLGGIIGYFNDVDVSVHNCFNSGDIDSSADNTFCNAIVGYSKSGSFDTAHFSDNYYLYMSAPGAIAIKDDAAPNEDFAVYATYDECVSGKVTYLLNGSVDDDTCEWYQTLGDGNDEYPVLFKNHAVVLFDGNTYYNQDVSAIYDVTYDSRHRGAIFTINGQEVSVPVRGLNISSGRKFVKK